jgi:hypothetical protein
MQKLLRYFRRKWGAPFVLAFMLLISTAAVESTLANARAANDIATYAFYSLAIGVVLQIASYSRYGSADEEASATSVQVPTRSMFSARTRRVLAILVIIVVLASVGTTAYLFTSTHGFNSLTVTINYVNVIKESAGTVVVAFAATAEGGAPPYNYSAAWPHGVVQESATGTFSRTFANQTVPAFVSLTVTSGDGQKVIKSVTIPPSSASSTSSTSSIVSTNSANSTNSVSSGSTTTSSTIIGNHAPLNLSASFTSELVEPNGNTTVIFGVSVTGGESPYNFVAVWSDGTVQSDTTGTFSRTFTSGEIIPTSAQVTVISDDDQNGTISVTFAPSPS